MVTPEKKFASQADLQEKKVSFDKLSENAYAYTAEGDPNTGIIIGDNAVLVADTGASSRARMRVSTSTAVGGRRASRVMMACGSPSRAYRSRCCAR